MSSPLGWFRLFLRSAVWLGMVSAMAMSLAADTPGNLRSNVAPAACACKCNQKQTRAGCSRLCDVSKRTARWSANSCAKPRITKPAETPGAGPRLPHPPRAERASL